MKKKDKNIAPPETGEDPPNDTMPADSSKYVTTFLVSLAKGEITPDELRKVLTELNGNNTISRPEE